MGDFFKDLKKDLLALETNMNNENSDIKIDSIASNKNDIKTLNETLNIKDNDINNDILKNMEYPEESIKTNNNQTQDEAESMTFDKAESNNNEEKLQEEENKNNEELINNFNKEETNSSNLVMPETSGDMNNSISSDIEIDNNINVKRYIDPITNINYLIFSHNKKIDLITPRLNPDGTIYVSDN